MKYAVVQTGGKQYKVSEGSVIEVEKLDVLPGSSYQLDQILLLADDGSYSVGKPVLENVAVTATVLEQKKGKKIRVAKFKAKARYRKVQGHRQHLTKLQIVTIGAGKPQKAASESTKETKSQSSEIKTTAAK